MKQEGESEMGEMQKSKARELFQKLLELVKEATKFGDAAALLEWDQQTQMPHGGAEGRAEIFAAVKAEAFKRFTSDDIGEILEKLSGERAELGPEEQALVNRVSAIYQRAKAIPADLYEKFNQAKSRSQVVWREAKQESNFELFRPHLQEMVGFMRQFADLYGYDENPYDGLLPDYEPGLTSAELKQIIAPLRSELVPFAQLLTDQPKQPDETLLQRDLPEDRQRQLSLEALRAIGYDFNGGRLDTTEHPFTISIGPGDVRVTTKFVRGKLGPALFGTLHEGGHALYGQGKDPLLKWLYLEAGYSHGMHESQSRMWENMVGRGLAFWKFFYPKLKQIFPYYKDVPLESFYHAINAVRPSLIRIYADEVTYNLHIMLRFEIEEALLRAKVEVKELPGLWNQKMKEYFGITPQNDAEGVLQDVHWSMGYFGYFPSYMLGNLYAAQLFSTAQREIPNLGNEIAKGNLAVLLSWLREKVHRFGLIYEAPQILREITGEGISSEPWLKYIQAKFRDIYGMG